MTGGLPALLLASLAATAGVFLSDGSPQTDEQSDAGQYQAASASTGCGHDEDFHLTHNGIQGGGIIGLQSAELEHDFTLDASADMEFFAAWNVPDATIQIRIVGPSGTVVSHDRQYSLPDRFEHNATLAAGSYTARISVFGVAVTQSFEMGATFC